MGILGEIEDLDTLVHVGIVGFAMALDVSLAAPLLVPPLYAHALVEGFLDPTVQLVHVHRVNTFLKPLPFGLKSCNRIAVFALLVGAALAKRAHDPLENLIDDLQPGEMPSKLLFENLFADIRLTTFPLEAGAVVIDVLLLLDFGDQGTPAMGAFDQSGKGEVLLQAAPCGSATIEDILHCIP